MKVDDELTGKIIGCAMKVHRTLGPGFLESVYHRALAHELCKAGLKVEVERPIRVIYDEIEVGEFAADLMINDDIIIEIKAVQSLVKAHEVQTVNYLTATRINIGLLINFGSRSLEFKKKFRTQKVTQDEVLF